MSAFSHQELRCSSPRHRYCLRQPWIFATFIALALIAYGAALPARALNYSTSWLGNSYGGTPNQLHVQDDIMAMYVAPDGTCYTNSTWDEGGNDAAICKNGQVTGYCQTLHGWGREGGRAITSDGTYLYVAMTETGDDGADTGLNVNHLRSYPDPNNIWYCVRRYNLSGTPVAFSGGYGPDGSMVKVSQGSRIDANHAYSGSQIAGLAVDPTNHYLYISDPNSNTISQYSIASGTLAATALAPFNCASYLSVGTMTMQTNSGTYLWVSEKYSNGTCVLISYNSGGGQVTGLNIPNVFPSALAYSSSNNTLYVADGGPDQNIKLYTVANGSSFGSLTGTFGVTGGAFAGTGSQIGTVGPQRFNNPTGVGVDSSGNLYVAQDSTCNYPSAAGGGGAILESYNASNGTRNWQLYGLEFVDNADVDPLSENDVFTKDKHFVMNWNNTAPGTEGAYYGYTVNRFKYPQDLRLHMGIKLASEGMVREFRGHKFLITTDQQVNYLGIFRFNAATDGECAIPSVAFGRGYQPPDNTGWPENQPSAGEWIWRDGNGNGAMDAGEYTQPTGQPNAPELWGWCVDTNGDIWQATRGAGIRHFVCQGLDSQGNPIYDYNHVTTIPMPAPFNDLERIEYHPETDTMYLSGYTSTNPYAGDWGVLGTTLCRYDHWSSGPALHVGSGYPILPTYTHSTNPATVPGGMSIAGQYLFITFSLQNQIFVYNSDTGVQVGTIVPGASVGGNGSNTNVLGWTDVRGGVRAYQRANGEFEIFNEADWLGKVVMYRWTPELQIQNRWQGTYLNVQSGLACSTINNSWTSADWIEEPTQNGTFRLRNLWTGQYLNVQASGALQCTAVSPTSTAAMWQLQDADSGYNYLCNLSNGQCINTETGLACSSINYSWWSAMWGLTNVN